MSSFFEEHRGATGESNGHAMEPGHMGGGETDSFSPAAKSLATPATGDESVAPAVEAVPARLPETMETMSCADDSEAMASLAGLSVAGICRPFNTTSTVIAASTVTNPDMEQIFFT